MKFALLATALMLPLAEPAKAPEPVQPAASSMPNAMTARPGCTPIAQQVAGEDRPPVGSRLDRQPPAHLLFAVDRQVGGCREVTFVRRAR